MMSIGDGFVVICLECIDDELEKMNVINNLKGKTIIEITENQVENYCGNILQVKGENKSYIVMSTEA